MRSKRQEKEYKQLYDLWNKKVESGGTQMTRFYQGLARKYKVSERQIYNRLRLAKELYGE